MNPRALAIAFAVVVVVVGCKSKAQEDSERAARREALMAAVNGEIEASMKVKDDAAAAAAAAAAADKAKADADAKAAYRRDVVAGKHLEVKNLDAFDKGILNHYRSVRGITLLNNSTLPVDGLQANVLWTGTNGENLGSTPLTLSGSIAAGDTKTFTEKDHTLTGGTLQGNGVHYNVQWTHVGVVGN